MMPFPASVPLRPVLAYLSPAVLLALILVRWGRANFAFAMIAFPGTVAHELQHFIVGYFVGARPVRLSLWPRRARDGSYVFGVVEFENLRWWNAAPASLAPLLGFVVAPLVALLRVRNGFVLSSWDVFIWLLLGQILASAWPSRVDWQLSLRSWPFALVAAAALMVHVLPY
ncbi:hypothetical protein [Paraburkholderia oxyphila]|uniref:hypothetical protein n=1 Tax=Paraburkholderia oxyphila TaxID=614212 RepID=UPI000694AD0F|nr:hypothetical protein [Paraburkholderia oxyphila]